MQQSNPTDEIGKDGSKIWGEGLEENLYKTPFHVKVYFAYARLPGKREGTVVRDGISEVFLRFVLSLFYMAK